MPGGERIFLSLGANLGDRAGNLARAVAELSVRGVSPVGLSGIYETEPVGLPGAPLFLNQVAEVETVLGPAELMQACLEVEASLGRVRRRPDASRTMDVDLLLYGARVQADPSCTLPHPRLAGRRFVLLPLAELAPGIPVPGTGETVEALLARCSRAHAVSPYRAAAGRA